MQENREKQKQKPLLSTPDFMQWSNPVKLSAITLMYFVYECICCGCHLLTGRPSVSIMVWSPWVKPAPGDEAPGWRCWTGICCPQGTEFSSCSSLTFHEKHLEPFFQGLWHCWSRRCSWFHSFLHDLFYFSWLGCSWQDSWPLCLLPYFSFTSRWSESASRVAH